MQEFSTYEFTVRQKTEGKWIAARVGLVFLYVGLVGAWLVFGLRTRILVPLLAFIPLSLWGLIFATWRFVNVEYEYNITSGVLTFTKVFGGRSRKKIFETPLREAVLIAPLDGGEYAGRGEAYRPEREFDAASSLRAPDLYFMLFEHAERGEKRRAIFYFEATARALQICRFYAPSATVITKTTR